MNLRSCGEDDWVAWRAVRLAALTEAPYAFGSTLADWRDATEERWRQRLRSVPCNMVVAIDGVDVGMASGFPEEGNVLLISMWVAPSARGHGVGDRLIESVTEWARELGVPAVDLDVVESNLPAIALYRRNGFVDAGPSTHDQIEGVPQRRMIFYFGRD
ncbi:MAG TPA: GNAT family N-acetyltransferase [Candidatus Tumulicola sp.]